MTDVSGPTSDVSATSDAKTYRMIAISDEKMTHIWVHKGHRLGPSKVFVRAKFLHIKREETQENKLGREEMRGKTDKNDKTKKGNKRFNHPFYTHAHSTHLIRLITILDEQLRNKHNLPKIFIFPKNRQIAYS